MKKLKEILAPIPEASIIGNADIQILHLTFDSRQVGEGSLFFAIKGTQHDGHDYIQEVTKKGVAAVVCESLPSDIDPTVTYILVSNASESMGKIASAFYDYPSSKIKLVAVTGTNGKTTVATLLYDLFLSFGHRCGLLSTVENRINGVSIASTHTTPDQVRINELLEEMVEQNCTYCFMEASSHAIDQNRISGLNLAGMIFTNITHDHLDYHHTFENYLKAKKKLFDLADETAFALTNKDDKNGTVMLQNTKASRYTYSLQGVSDFKGKIIESDFNGMLLNIDGEEALYKLVGHFNAYNLLAVYGAAFLLGKEKKEIITHLSNIGAVKGRFDYLRSKNGVVAVVDYAHTPDALKNVLETINQVRTKNENLITIIGCGGNRDKTKRPIMADVATEYSNKVIFTSDNPRNENPETILDEMQSGVKPLHYKKTLRITDRKEAIKTAVSMASKGDIILIAGKGHENYQEINGIKHPFDDKQIVTELFEIMN